MSPFMQIVASFSAGAFGSAVGALTSIVLCALVALAGGLTMYFHEVAVQTGNSAISEVSTLFMWSLGLISLMFLVDRMNIPIFHHIGLCAAVGAQMVLKFGANEYIVMLWSLALGIVAAYSGDILGKLFHVNGPGIVDPPSAAIAFTAPFGLSIFPALGIARPGSVLNILVPALLIVCAVIYEHYMHLAMRSGGKDIPEGVLAVGNPCRVLREINEHDAEYFYKNEKIDWENL